MNEALAAFSGTPEEGSLIIGNAYLYVELGNVDAAINHLVSIRPEQLYVTTHFLYPAKLIIYVRHFTSSRKAMAKIYLDYKNDRKNYAKCFGEIVEYTASLESRLLLGDAYMNIQEPEQAVTVYKSALEAYPEELSLRGKIGEALTKTHDFKRVLFYFVI